MTMGPTKKNVEHLLTDSNFDKFAFSGDEERFRTKVSALEKEIIESRSNLNNIAKLLSYTQEQHTVAGSIVLTALCRIFLRLFIHDDFSSNLVRSDGNLVILKWLRSRLEEYIDALLKSIRESDTKVAVVSLDLHMQVLDAESHTWETGDPTARTISRLSSIATAIFQSQNRRSIQTYFIERYALKYVDIQQYTYQCFSNCLHNGYGIFDIGHTISFLSELGFPTDNGQRTWLSSHTQPQPNCQQNRRLCTLKKHAGESWLLILALDLSRRQRNQLLTLMVDLIAPLVGRLERVSDFLDDSFRIGGATSLMALSGIFHLIRQKNLDYPGFYTKLYSLLGPETLHSKHRSRLLRLLETFLASTHLPSTLIASFVKRLCRLCLYSPPSATVAIVPFIYNLVKSHPICAFMLHRVRRRSTNENKIGKAECIMDPFDMTEVDPTETRAINSSLWEIDLLQSHFHPNVATICKIMSGQFTRQTYSLEDFLDHSYSSIMESELSKKLKKRPVVEHYVPKDVLFNNGAITPYKILSLWEFDT